MDNRNQEIASFVLDNKQSSNIILSRQSQFNTHSFQNPEMGQSLMTSIYSLKDKNILARKYT